MSLERLRTRYHGPGGTAHVLRHTAATWGMQRRAEPWQLAGYLGMSVQTLIRVYGHHHPDYQRAAVAVFDRPGERRAANDLAKET